MTGNVDAILRAHLDLIQFFRDGHCTTAEEVANRYQISVRTAQRYISRVADYVPLQRNGPNIRRLVLR